MGYTGNMNELRSEFRQNLVDHLVAHGKAFNERKFHNEYFDWEGSLHIDPEYDGKCSVAAIDQADVLLEEMSLAQWGGTFGDSTEEVRVVGHGFSCKCGQLTNMSLSVVGSFHMVLFAAMGIGSGDILDATDR